MMHLFSTDLICKVTDHLLIKQMKQKEVSFQTVVYSIGLSWCSENILSRGYDAKESIDNSIYGHESMMELTAT